MAYIDDATTNTGYFIETTSEYDVQLLADIEVNSQEFRDLLVRLYETVNNIRLAVNAKDTAYYPEQEFNTGGILFNQTITNNTQQPQIFRRRVTTGALGAGVTTVAHGLNTGATWEALSIYGAATNATGPVFYPLPFAGVGVGNIQVDIDATNININNGSGATFTSSYVIFLYVKY